MADGESRDDGGGAIERAPWDWAWLEREWFLHPTESLKEFAEIYGVPADTLYHQAARRKWLRRKRAILARSRESGDNLLAEKKARELAEMDEQHYDTARLLLAHLRFTAARGLQHSPPLALPVATVYVASRALKELQHVMRLAKGADKPDAGAVEPETFIATVSEDGIANVEPMPPLTMTDEQALLEGAGREQPDGTENPEEGDE